MTDPEADGDAAADASSSDPFDGPGWHRAARRRSRTRPDQVRRRVHGRSKRRRRLVLGAFAIGALVLAALAWLLYTGLKARTELEAVRAQVHSLQAQISAGDLSAAEATARSLRQHATNAHDLTTGPVWAVAAEIPYLGDPLATARALSANISAIANDTVPALVDASSSLDGASLREANGSFDLARIEGIAPALDTAFTTMRAASLRVTASPGSTWLGSVNTARADLIGQLQPLTETVRRADVAARALPALLGADGPKNYFVSFQNEAELRGLGGLPGAFAILRADHGRLSFTKFKSDTTLAGVNSGLDFGFQYDQLYSSMPDSTQDYADSNASPHFPNAARIWLAMWHHKTGEQLDGAITLDPTALSYLLAVTGPARTPDGTTVSAANVVRLTENSAYLRFGPHNSKRKKFLLDVAQAASKKLLDTHADLTVLIRAGARAVTEHRLLVWTSDAGVENQLATTPIGGTVQVGFAPYVGLAIDNDGANKLDYYLHAAVDWSAATCGNRRTVTVTIRLRNDAPANLPTFILGFTGRPGFPQTPGVNRSIIQLFASEASQPTSVTLNGRPLGVSTGYEQARPGFTFNLDIPRNRTQTVVFHLTEPSIPGALITRMQPMVNPVQLTTHETSCSS